MASEIKINLPILNPETGAPSRTFEYWGTIDELADGKVSDYKTTKDPDQFIFEKRISYQPELYAHAAEVALGVTISEVEYRVIQSPQILMCRTDEKNATEWGISVPDAYERRCVEWLWDSPSKLQTHTIPINRRKMDSAKQWLWDGAKRILENRRATRWMTNENACYKWSKQCEYGNACAQMIEGVDWKSTIDRFFKKAEIRYGEENPKLEPLSYSQVSLLTLCEMKYWFRYELGVVPDNHYDEATHTGSASHVGIAAFRAGGQEAAFAAVDEWFKRQPVIGSLADKVEQQRRRVRAIVRAASQKWPAQKVEAA